MKKATLYTAASLNGSFLLTSIDIALWLNKSEGFKEITIIACDSGYSSYNFFSLLLRFKNLFTPYAVNKIKRIFESSKKNLKFKKKKISALASFSIGKLDQTYLTFGNLEIKLVRERFDRKNFYINFVTVYLNVANDYLKYFRKSALKRRAYIQYKVDNINSGLYILSEALRSDYRCFGSIFHARLGILAALYKLNKSIINYKKIVFTQKGIKFVYGPEQEYTIGFFSQFMCNRGAYFIDISHDQKPFIKFKIKKKFHHRIKILKLINNKTCTQKKNINNYYNNRIEKPWKALPYMIILKKKKKEPLNKQLINTRGVCAIIYLHSFADAHFLFGYDGFADTQDWAFNTISLLNSNKHVSTVIVKRHPSFNPFFYPGEADAYDYLKSKFLGFEKIQWVDFHFNVKEINRRGSVIGVTRYGSVAEELVFSGFPVVGSSFSPWGNEYKFGYWWNNVKDYKSLISSKLFTKLVVTKTQTNELYRYAMNKYFHKYSHAYFDVDSSWKDIFKIYKVDNCYEHSEVIRQLIHLVEKLDPQDRQFKKFIETRQRRINLLFK